MLKYLQRIGIKYVIIEIKIVSAKSAIVIKDRKLCYYFYHNTIILTFDDIYKKSNIIWQFYMSASIKRILFLQAILLNGIV